MLSFIIIDCIKKTVIDYVIRRRFWRIFIFMLNYQVHIFHSFAVFRAGGNDINSGRVDAAVTENVGKFGNIFFNSVKHPCKQMAQVMWKNLLRVDVCFLA